MARNVLDFRPATVDLVARPGFDLTWRVTVTDEGITPGAITCTVGNQTPDVNTDDSATGMLVADITLTAAQTEAIGATSVSWVFANEVGGVDTPYITGNYTGSTAGNTSNGLRAGIVATSGRADVDVLVSTSAATAIAAHLIDPTDAHDASAVSVLDAAAHYAAGNVEAALAEAAVNLGLHLSDNSDAHDASTISVADAAGHFTATDTEAALAETALRVRTLESPTAISEYIQHVMGPTSTIDGLVTDGNATTASGWYASTSSGTMAISVLTLYGDPKSIKFSFVVKVTKGTASSESRVGLHINGTPGTIPAGGNYTFTVGYKQGVGICFVRDNVGPDVVILADASVSDGQEYVINAVYDRVHSGATANTQLTVRVATLADARAAAILFTTVNNGTFTPVTNLVIKSNVDTGGLRDLRVQSPVGGRYPVGRLASHYMQTTDSASQSCYWLFPARTFDPLRLVILCHGAGGTPANLDADTPTGIRAFGEGLCRAGFVVAFHAMHADNWGNASGLADVVRVYEAVRDNYDKQTKVYMLGFSMGTLAAALTARVASVPVKAVYTIDGVYDLEWAFAQAAFTAGITSAHPGGLASRDAANPMLYPGSDWAGIPFRMVASASDTSVSKADNTDLFAAKSGLSATVNTVTGVHGASTHFLPADAASFFLANL